MKFIYRSIGVLNVSLILFLLWYSFIHNSYILVLSVCILLYDMFSFYRLFSERTPVFFLLLPPLFYNGVVFAFTRHFAFVLPIVFILIYVVYKSTILSFYEFKREEQSI